MVNVNVYKYGTYDPLFDICYKNGRIDLQAMISNIVKIDKRNDFIIKIICDLIDQGKRKICVISGRLYHLEILKQKLNEKTLNYKQHYKVSFCSVIRGYGHTRYDSIIFTTPTKKGISYSHSGNTEKLVVEIRDKFPIFNKLAIDKIVLYAIYGHNLKTIDYISNDDVLNSGVLNSSVMFEYDPDSNTFSEIKN